MHKYHRYSNCALCHQEKCAETIGNYKYKTSKRFAEKRRKILLSKYQRDTTEYFLVPTKLTLDNSVSKLISYFKQLLKLSFIPVCSQS